MRLLLAMVLAVVALAMLGIVSLAAAAGGRPSAVPVGGVHDVTQVDHDWSTVQLR